jgi:hypothetical protein
MSINKSHMNDVGIYHLTFGKGSAVGGNRDEPLKAVGPWPALAPTEDL